MKLLSIAVPCYNSEGYMRNCIESLLPGGEEVEIIIVDDGSTKDRTAEIADEYAAKLASLNLPEETMRLIDQYVNERSANWVRYGELAYMLGFSDCKELLLGSCHIPEMKDED